MSSINHTSAHRPASEWNPETRENTQRPLSAIEHCIVGLTAKTVAVYAYHPLLMLKFDQQTASAHHAESVKRSNPWKGIGVNLWNAPLYSVMATVNGILNNYFAGSEKRTLLPWEHNAIVAISAACGAYPTAVLDLIMIQKKALSKQMSKNLSAWQTIEHIVAARGVWGLNRGMIPAFLREVPYGWTMMQGGPVVKDWYKERLPEQVGVLKKPVAITLSSLTIGPLCSLVTQFSDMVKSVVQSRCLTHERAELYKTGRAILQKGAQEAVQAFVDGSQTHHWTHQRLPRNTPLAVVAFLGGLRLGHTGLILRTKCFVVATGVMVVATPLFEIAVRKTS